MEALQSIGQFFARWLAQLETTFVEKQRYLLLEDEHVALLTEYEKTFDLATIKAAAEEAGMSKPSAGQIQYIDLSGADSAVVYGDEPGVVEKAASSLKEGALSLWEYFS